MDCFTNFENENSPNFISVEKCIFTNIHSEHNGGCILETRAVTFLITRTVFYQCSSLERGGAFYIQNSNTYATIHKTCFSKISSNNSGFVFYAECKTVISFLNLCFQNSNDDTSFLLRAHSNYNDRQSNFSNNIAYCCPCFYIQFGSANVKEITEVNSIGKFGAIIDTNHMPGNVIFERFNVIFNKIEEDSLGLFFFDNDTYIELHNIYAFNNIGIKKFATSTNLRIYSYSCYTDFKSPSIGFTVHSYTFNDFKTLESCYITKINQNFLKYLSVTCMFIACLLTSSL